MISDTRPTITDAVDAVQHWLNQILMPDDGHWLAYLHQVPGQWPWISLHVADGIDAAWRTTVGQDPIGWLTLTVETLADGWRWQSGNTPCLTITGTPAQPVVTEHPSAVPYLLQCLSIMQQQAIKKAPAPSFGLRLWQALPRPRWMIFAPLAFYADLSFYAHLQHPHTGALGLLVGGLSMGGWMAAVALSGWPFHASPKLSNRIMQYSASGLLLATALGLLAH